MEDIPPFLRGGDYPINDGVENTDANGGANRVTAIGRPPDDYIEIYCGKQFHKKSKLY